jgi:VWFA-related protein
MESPMRLAALAVLLGVCVWAPSLAQPKGPNVPYRIEFDSGRDVTLHDRDEKTGKEGLFVSVHFTITLEEGTAEVPGTDYKIIIEEDGHRVREEDVPRPTPSEELSVVLAIDTSGSMREHGRMAQAKTAANVFLDKLPAKADCGLILFDHEMRPPVLAPTPDRGLLRKEIQKVEPRGGTAYLDAAAKAIDMLKSARRRQQRAAVIMTDGIDLNSTASLEAVIQAARQNRVKVYTIGIGEPGKLERVSSALVLDHSGSMQAPADEQESVPKIKALHRAAARFVSVMPSTGRVTLVPFNTTVGTPQPFSNHKVTLQSAIQSLTPEGETALFDATYTAIATLEAEGAKGKRNVVAMTDGIDNSSRRRVDEVIARAREAKIALHMLGFGRKGELDEKTMTEMASQTGGKYYHAQNEKALLEIFENLSIDLHDDGIDETTLTTLASQTGGQYYPAKNVQDLKLILEQVTQNIQRKEYVVTFPSLRQVRDGTARNVTLKLVRRTGELASNQADHAYQAGEQVVEQKQTGYQTHGVVVAEMDHMVYLVLLVIIGALILAPAVLKGRAAPAGR